MTPIKFKPENKPYRVLDAPLLSENFYCNMVNIYNYKDYMVIKKLNCYIFRKKHLLI